MSVVVSKRLLPHTSTYLFLAVEVNKPLLVTLDDRLHAVDVSSTEGHGVNQFCNAT
eukprot:m.316575 g.316575  ORF g.316575 m.316575 type:complete len:56 (-) comp19679_c0_seq11:3493-3660(-)